MQAKRKYFTHQLSNDKSCYKQQTRTLDERPTPRSRDEYKGLADGTHLQVNYSGELPIVVRVLMVKARNPKGTLKTTNTSVSQETKP